MHTKCANPKVFGKGRAFIKVMFLIVVYNDYVSLTKLTFGAVYCVKKCNLHDFSMDVSIIIKK